MTLLHLRVRSTVQVIGALLCLFVSPGYSLAEERPATSVAGRVVHAPAPSRDGQLKVLVYHDMEGLTGQDDPRTYSHPNRAGPENADLYAHGQELLMADVNAVIDGLYLGGADSVFVVDAHGSGNVEPDIVTEKLDPRAKQIFRDEFFLMFSAGYPALPDLVPPGTYDAVVLVGAHGKSGGEGFSSHTITPGWLPYLNGASITEAEGLALEWGQQSVPLIFVSGDDQLEKEISDSLPWVEYVVTKRSRKGKVVELLPADEVRAELRERARVAASRWMEMQAVTLTEPVHVKIQTFAPLTLEPLRGVPGITFDGDMLTFVAPDFQEMRKNLWALLLVATGTDWDPPRGKRGYHGAL